MGVPSYTVKTDSETTGNTIYIGRCNSAVADDDGAVWSIQRVTINGDDVTIENAGGDETPNKIWANRASLEYK